MKPWVEKVGWSSLVEMVHAVWFNLVLEDSGLGWVGVLIYILFQMVCSGYGVVARSFAD